MTASEDQLPAGRVSTWVAATIAAQGEHGDGIDVPCGSCTACCRSSYFVHVGPEETETRKRIPAALLFAAPGLPKGHHVLGYDERGHCPMLTEAGCSIYEHRPRTCRTFDCRVFAAAALPEADGKPEIAIRVRSWRFETPTVADAAQLDAVRAAAAYLLAHPDCFGAEGPPPSRGQVALLAVKVHHLFLEADGCTAVEPPVEAVRAALA
jgi:Fe-S-cluster containining protein